MDKAATAEAKAMMSGAGQGSTATNNVSGQVDRHGSIEGVDDIEGGDQPGGPTPVSPEDAVVAKAKKGGGLMGNLGSMFSTANAASKF